MTSIQKTKFQPWTLLVLGSLLVAATHMSLGIGVLAWVSCIPFLIYLRKTKGIKSRIWLGVALVIGWTLSVLKIISNPIPVFFAPIFSIPIALWQFGAYIGYDRLRSTRGGMLIFPALMVVGEWIQWKFTPLASWGAMAYTQVENLPVLQLVSLFGMAGLGFLIYWVNMWAEARFFARTAPVWLTRITIGIVIGVLVFGGMRLGLSERMEREEVMVAAIGTECTVSGLPIPDREERDVWGAALFHRTRLAADRGAEVVVWNEGANAILPAEEVEWEQKLSNLAKETQVELYTSYIVPISMEPLLYENKALHFGPDGTHIQTYLKHEPVAGEPAVKGTSPLEVHQTAWGKIGTAICYDYDYPALARGYGKLDADLVVVPSSDWRGIDPVHTQMAALRAIENGHSILRSTRMGLSAGIDPYGRMQGLMSHFDSAEKILMTTLPVEGRTTLYTWIGDVVVLLSILLIIGIPVANWRKKRREGEAQKPALD